MPLDNDLPINCSPLERANAHLRWEQRTGAGKGDLPRPVRGNSYRKNYQRIFRPTHKHGN
jgi:hypothetical protein